MATTGATSSEPTRGRSSTSRRTIAAVVVVVLIAGLAWLAWQWRHPTELYAHSSTTIGVDNTVGATDSILLVSLPTSGERHTITIHSAEPRITRTSPGASVEVVLCSGGEIGAVRGSLDKYCTSVQPAAGATVLVGSGTKNSLLARIHSDEPGKVTIDGADVSYASGWRDGTQTTGITVVATFAR